MITYDIEKHCQNLSRKVSKYTLPEKKITKHLLYSHSFYLYYMYIYFWSLHVFVLNMNFMFSGEYRKERMKLLLLLATCLLNVTCSFIKILLFKKLYHTLKYFFRENICWWNKLY